MAEFTRFGGTTHRPPDGDDTPSHQRHHWATQPDGVRRPPGWPELPPPTREGQPGRVAAIGRPVPGWDDWARAVAARTGRRATTT